MRKNVLRWHLYVASFVVLSSSSLCFGTVGAESPLSGDILPVFGRSCILIDTETGERQMANVRSINDRYKDYFHECVKRNPLKEVSEKSINQWKINRYSDKSLSGYTRNIQVEYRDQFKYYEDLTARIAAEFFRYDTRANFGEIVEIQNRIYTVDYAMVWDGLPKWSKHKKKLDRLLYEIEERLHALMDKLDVIHRGEYLAWQAEHRQEYAQKVKQRDDRIANLHLAIKMDRNAREIIQAKEEAVQAKEAAHAAEIRAAAAERAAQDAYDVIRNAEERARRDWRRLP